jgi:serine/threonine protein kinase
MQSPSPLRPLKVGARLGPDLTVLGTVDKQKRNPVYIVWHHRAWCPMACKLFSTRERAEREAEALAAMAHPNTVRSFGVAEPACLLMEFLEGPTLARLIDTSPRRLPLADCLRVAIYLGAALHHIHERGYLHLDVKPGNVIVSRGRPVLYDLGSARRRTDSRPDTIAGTDPYIAPEECLLETVGPPADVFGLGVTLHEMLTGKLPFPRGTRKNPFPQTTRPPTPLRRHRAGAPAALEKLLLACLARNPAERPALPDLLPPLHALIRQGPPMWPAGFDPRG